MTIPNSKNFCGGNFQNWIEVNLIDKCNGHCSWCIEKDGYKPEYHASWQAITQKALESGKQNIILLGGEPTLYKDIKDIIITLNSAGRNVWITTNGSMLNPIYIYKNLMGITGINISIHDYNLEKNKEIVGVYLNKDNLINSIEILHRENCSVRLNCNCVSGHIDSVESIYNYIEFAKEINADKIRFAELKQDDGGFVDLAKILNYKYGLNDNPFTDGCNSDAVINGMPINFRQMCGLQTSRRIRPEDPEQSLKEVLYYDGKIYNGWQANVPKETKMKGKELVELLSDVAKGKLSVAEAALIIGRKTGEKKEIIKHLPSAPGCAY